MAKKVTPQAKKVDLKKENIDSKIKKSIAPLFITVLIILVVSSFIVYNIIIQEDNTRLSGNNLPSEYNNPSSGNNLPSEYCGDLICQDNENCFSCSYDCGMCKKNFGEYCDNAQECINNYCVHNFCRNSITYCGDKFCDSGERETCSSDCMDEIVGLFLDCLKRCPSDKGGIFGLFKNIEPTCLEGCQKIVNLKFDPSSYEQMTEEEAIESMKGISNSNLIKWNCVISCEPLWRYDCTQNCLE